MIHSLKILILKSFAFLVAVLGRFCLAGAMMVIGAQGLAFMDHADQYAFLKYFLAFEHCLEAPIVSFLHAGVPCVYSGFDLAPVAIATVLIVLWIMCEVELHRLRVSTWTVAQDKKAATQKLDAARALKKAA